MKTTLASKKLDRTLDRAVAIQEQLQQGLDQERQEWVERHHRARVAADGYVAELCAAAEEFTRLKDTAGESTARVRLVEAAKKCTNARHAVGRLARKL